MKQKILKADKAIEFTFKSIVTKGASGELFIEGYANTVDRDRVADIVDPKAFSKSLPQYMQNPVLMENHDWTKVAGKIVTAEIDKKGLKVRARISDTREDLKTLIREGCLSTMSIGFNELQSDYDEKSKTKYIKDLELLEISVVSIPANPEAKFVPVEGSASASEEPAPAAEPEKAIEPEQVKELSQTETPAVAAEQPVEAPAAEVQPEPAAVEPEAVKSPEAPIAEPASETPAETTPVESTKELPEPEAEEEDPTGETLKEIASRLGQLADGLAQILERMNDKDKEEANAEAAEQEPPKEEPAPAPAQDEEKSIEKINELEKFVSELESELSDLE